MRVERERRIRNGTREELCGLAEIGTGHNHLRYETTKLPHRDVKDALTIQ
jgi:hypothetical protein